MTLTRSACRLRAIVSPQFLLAVESGASRQRHPLREPRLTRLRWGRRQVGGVLARVQVHDLFRLVTARIALNGAEFRGEQHRRAAGLLDPPHDQGNFRRVRMVDAPRGEAADTAYGLSEKVSVAV